MSQSDADQVLVERVQRGDKTAFDLLVLRYQHRIVKLIGRYVRDHAEALDVAQDAFLRAYRALPAFRGESAFYTWLYRIAVNTAKNHLASQAHRMAEAGIEIDAAREAGRVELREIGSPDRLLQRDQLEAAMLAALEALPEELRSAILLREVEGLSYEEIALAMECPVGTVRSRIFRARDAINARIAPLVDC